MIDNLKRTTAIILSAGFSIRMGRFKPCLPCGSGTVLGHVLQTCQRAGIDDIRVVAGFNRGQLTDTILSSGATEIVNKTCSNGMFSSIQAGLKHLEPRIDAAVIWPVDIPLIRPETIRQLLETQHQNGGLVIKPSFRGHNGHPVIIPFRFFKTVQEWSGNQGLKGVLATLKGDTLVVDTADENILFDIDTEADYQELCNRYKTHHVPSPEECRSILDRFSVSADVREHCREVAGVADEICSRLELSRYRVDRPLVLGAALLHDLAKGQRNHAEAGAEFLKQIGFAQLADVVATHTDIHCSTSDSVSAGEILYLADKRVAGVRRVSIKERFQSAFDRFGDQPVVRRKIHKRMVDAYLIQEKIDRISCNSCRADKTG